MDGERRGWRVALAVLVVLSMVPVAVGGAAPATAGTAAETTAGTAYLDHHLSLGDANDSVRVRMTLREVPGVESFSFPLPPSATVTSTDGFERRDGQWYWDGVGSEPSLAYELPVDAPGDTRVRGEDWAVVAHLSTPISWTESRDVAVERRFSGEGGYAGDEAVSAGNVTLRTFEAAGETSTVVVPGVVADEVDVAGVGNVTTDLAVWFPTGEERARTSVFVLPAGVDFGAAGVAVGGGDFLVTSSLAGGDREVEPGVFAHEYTHTRQSFRTGSKMAWFTEGSARYYEHRYVYERGHRSFGFYDRAVSVSGAPCARSTPPRRPPTRRGHTSSRRWTS